MLFNFNTDLWSAPVSYHANRVLLARTRRQSDLLNSVKLLLPNKTDIHTVNARQLSPIRGRSEKETLSVGFKIPLKNPPEFQLRAICRRAAGYVTSRVASGFHERRRSITIKESETDDCVTVSTSFKCVSSNF